MMKRIGKTDFGKHGLHVPGGIVVRSYQSCGTPKERVGPSGNDNSLRFSLFTGGSGETLISNMFGRGQGLSGEGGLINGDIDGIV